MKRILAVLSALIILTVSQIAVFAMPGAGNISVALINKATKKPMSGENVIFVKVADCAYTDDGYKFNLTSALSGTGIDITDTDAANALYEKIGSLSGYTATSNSEGQAIYANCEIGAYLVYSPKELFNPFIVFVPMEGETDYAFDITAEPKIDIPEEPTTEPTSQNDDDAVTSTEIVTQNDDTKTTTAAAPQKEQLPYTGMMQLPIPLLGCAGLMLFAKGFLDYAGSKKKEE